jgi:hypothetical protein
MTDDALLVLVDNAIAALLSGGAVKSWGEGGHNVEHMSLSELMALKTEVENRIFSSSGAMCLPVREVDV